MFLYHYLRFIHLSRFVIKIMYMILSAFFCLSHTHGSIPLKALAPCYIFRLKLKVQIPQKKCFFYFCCSTKLYRRRTCPNHRRQNCILILFCTLWIGKLGGGRLLKKVFSRKNPSVKHLIYMYICI